MAKKRKAPVAEPQPEPVSEPQPESVSEPQPEPELQPDEEPDEEPQQLHLEEEEQNESEEEESDPEPDLDTKPDTDEEDDIGTEPVEKLLEPFGKDQLVLLIKEAVNKHPDLMKCVNTLADADPAHRKVFVHGLGWDTTAETLVSEFAKYGEIEDCKAVVDKVSGKSKGYAFILFKHRVGAKKALVEPQKKIGNRVTSCQLASAGPVPAPPPVAPPVSEYTQRKIFVSNVAAEVEPAKLLELFSQFGEIEEGPLGMDKVTGRPKGFCLFVYRSLEGAKKALEEPHKVLDGVTLHCYKAVDGPRPGHKGGFQSQQHGFQNNHPHSSKRFKGPNKYPPRGGGGGGPPHMMGPNHMSPAAAALAPALGQALTSLLAGQGGGLGNLLGGFGGQVNQGVPPNQGYGVQPGGGGYGMQAAYPNQQMGQGGGRPQMGGGAPPYMGHGH